METKHHTKLTANERDLIAVWRGGHVTVREIARRLGRSPSTISDELTRNRYGESYIAIHAQAVSEKRKLEARKRHPLKNKEVYSYVLAKLEKGWSPETVAGRLKKHNGRTIICHETIYQFVYESDYGRREKLYQYLRRGKKHRTKYHGRRSQKEAIPNRIFVDKRPEDVAARSDIGHWEGDSIIYRDKQAINSLVERKSRFVVLTKLERKTALLTQQAVSRIINLPHEWSYNLTIHEPAYPGSNGVRLGTIPAHVGDVLRFHTTINLVIDDQDSPLGFVVQYKPSDRSRFDELFARDFADYTEIFKSPDYVFSKGGGEAWINREHASLEPEWSAQPSADDGRIRDMLLSLRDTYRREVGPPSQWRPLTDKDRTRLRHVVSQIKADRHAIKSWLDMATIERKDDGIINGTT